MVLQLFGDVHVVGSNRIGIAVYVPHGNGLLDGTIGGEHEQQHAMSMTPRPPHGLQGHGPQDVDEK